MKNKLWMAMTLLLLVGGCGQKRPAAPTAEQNQQLNEAENMLDEDADNSR